MTMESRQPVQATLPERLVAASAGTIEWRVADPVSGAYCIAYSRADYLDPEREAREWLRKHRKEFPTGRFIEHEARRVLVQSELQRLAVEAAAELQRLRALLDQANRVVADRGLGGQMRTPVAEARALSLRIHEAMLGDAGMSPGLPGVIGVSRMLDNRRALLLSLDSEPTDDQIRALHEALG